MNGVPRVFSSKRIDLSTAASWTPGPCDRWHYPVPVEVWDDRLVNQACDLHRVMPVELHLTTRRHVDLMRLVGTGCMPAASR